MIHVNLDIFAMSLRVLLAGRGFLSGLAADDRPMAYATAGIGWQSRALVIIGRALALDGFRAFRQGIVDHGREISRLACRHVDADANALPRLETRPHAGAQALVLRVRKAPGHGPVLPAASLLCEELELQREATTVLHANVAETIAASRGDLRDRCLACGRCRRIRLHHRSWLHHWVW